MFPKSKFSKRTFWVGVLLLIKHHVLKIINEVFVIAIVNDITWIPEVDFLETKRKEREKA